jgi:hypothetical protein
MITKTTITLGGTEYQVRPLTLRQLRLVFPVLGKLRGLDLNNPESTDPVIEAIVTTLKRDYPDVTVDVILDMEITVEQLTTAIRTIGAMSGLKYEEPKTPGENLAA